MEALGAKRSSLEGQLAAAAAGGAEGFAKVEALSKQLAQVGGAQQPCYGTGRRLLLLLHWME